MSPYRITLDDHRCRPIDAEDWKYAIGIAVRRAFGPKAFAQGLYDIRNGHGYVDIYRSNKGNAAPRIASHVSLSITKTEE